MCTRIDLPKLSSFEGLCTRLSVGGESFIFLSIYRPGTLPAPATFFDELTTVLESLVLNSCPVLIGGDFNVHVEDPTNPQAVRLSEVFSSFNLIQHVRGPTHKHGHTLDLVVTFSDCRIDDVTVDPAGIISDHGLVMCRVPARRVVVPVTDRVVRSWRSVSRPEFMNAIRTSPLGCDAPTGNAAELFEIYDATLRRIADQFAPTHAVRSRQRPLAPWFDSECRTMRRECRRLERKYRRTKNIEDRTAWTKAVRQKHVEFRSRKNSYWTERVNGERHSPSKLWRSVQTIMRREKSQEDASVQPDHTADSFMQYFDSKVRSVRSSTDGHPVAEVKVTTTASLPAFRACTTDDVRRIVMKSPTKSCALDSIPTFMLKESIDVLLPFLTAMSNASMLEGSLPQSQRHASDAIVAPLLKKIIARPWRTQKLQASFKFNICFKDC